MRAGLAGGGLKEVVFGKCGECMFGGGMLARVGEDLRGVLQGGGGGCGGGGQWGGEDGVDEGGGRGGH